MINKQEADRLMRIKGESRGVNIKIDLDYILEKRGNQGILMVEKKMKELGYPLESKEIDQMDFYPLGMEAITLLCIRDVLNLNDQGIEEMGRKLVKFSIFMKILIKYFGSLKLVAKEVPRAWKQYYTIGALEMPEYSNEKRFAILRQKGFKVHPIYCLIHKGYFLKISQMVVGRPGKCEETKCVFKGDSYNEFLITW